MPAPVLHSHAAGTISADITIRIWRKRLADAVLSTPAAAMGVLHLIGAAISRKSYWRETYRVLAAPAFLSLLSIVVARHPLMHEKVLTLPMFWSIRPLLILSEVTAPRSLLSVIVARHRSCTRRCLLPIADRSCSSCAVSRLRHGLRRQIFSYGNVAALWLRPSQP